MLAALASRRRRTSRPGTPTLSSIISGSVAKDASLRQIGTAERLRGLMRLEVACNCRLSRPVRNLVLGVPQSPIQALSWSRSTLGQSVDRGPDSGPGVYGPYREELCLSIGQAARYARYKIHGRAPRRLARDRPATQGSLLGATLAGCAPWHHAHRASTAQAERGRLVPSPRFRETAKQGPARRGGKFPGSYRV